MSNADPLEIVIQYLLADAPLKALVNGRIAPVYGDDWGAGVNAIQLHQDGGTPDLYAYTQQMRLEARCYGASLYEAGKVYGRLVQITRLDHREAVTLDDGTNGLLHDLWIESNASQLYDDQLQTGFVLCFLGAWVAEELVS